MTAASRSDGWAPHFYVGTATDQGLPWRTDEHGRGYQPVKAEQGAPCLTCGLQATHVIHLRPSGARAVA